MKNPYIIIRANGAVEAISGEGDKPELKLLQSAVGGWIEHVYCRRLDGQGIDMFCNEEGKLNGLSYNERATHLQSWPDDYVVGDAVLVGHSEDGDSTWLTDSQVNTVFAAFGLELLEAR